MVYFDDKERFEGPDRRARRHGRADDVRNLRGDDVRYRRGDDVRHGRSDDVRYGRGARGDHRGHGGGDLRGNHERPRVHREHAHEYPARRERRDGNGYDRPPHHGNHPPHPHDAHGPPYPHRPSHDSSRGRGDWDRYLDGHRPSHDRPHDGPPYPYAHNSHDPLPHDTGRPRGLPPSDVLPHAGHDRSNIAAYVLPPHDRPPVSPAYDSAYDRPPNNNKQDGADQGDRGEDRGPSGLSVPVSIKKVVIPVANNLAGGLIGKRGAVINFLRSESKAEIKIGDSPEGGDRMVTVTGSEDAVTRAIGLINDILEEESSKLDSRDRAAIVGVGRDGNAGRVHNGNEMTDYRKFNENRREGGGSGQKRGQERGVNDRGESRNAARDGGSDSSGSGEVQLNAQYNPYAIKHPASQAPQ